MVENTVIDREPSTARLTHLQRLEGEAIQIMREAVAESERPAMLYSIGKDSSVMLHLARKAFFPSVPPSWTPFKRTREPVVTELVVAGPVIASLRIRDLLEDPRLQSAMAVTSDAAMDTEQTVIWSRPAPPRPRPYDREVDGLNALDGAA